MIALGSHQGVEGLEFSSPLRETERCTIKLIIIIIIIKIIVIKIIII